MIFGFTLTQLIIFAVIGIIAGFLAGRVMKGRGFGLLGDLVIGLLGGLLGGFLVKWLKLMQYSEYIVQIVVAFFGACILIWLLRLIKK
jgi:uncharacterized membrane protein YeaQ/YmgE (transglycosylase-associated protein family)